MEDNEITRSVDGMLEELKDNKYVFRDYANIVTLLYQLKNVVGFKNIKVEKFVRVMNNLIAKDDKIYDLRFIHWDYEAGEQEITKLLQLREQRNLELDANILEEKGAYESVDRFCEECNLRTDYYVQNKSFMDCVNINSLIMLLEDASLEEIYKIGDVFSEIYRMGNIKDFFVDDLKRLNDLEAKVLEKKDEIGAKGITYKYAINVFYSLLNEIIKRLE
ncbi:hypothetical protein SAMN04487831_11741 [Pseudobutyrivibrio sp. UC1225]|uniref:hypothetical protein n=1 Tax=Pseudobutyrivibrio sp. UC1225 TaxID=1798185 RepID=UPI0008F2D565|nr:hypothetical protein [Pseudobutyrivibrio sp. UC1225]SFO29894.1 hypothetical protein SAMN04487831_11741 [Pseudobutyrivibrio sp. UC1225]